MKVYKTQAEVKKDIIKIEGKKYSIKEIKEKPKGKTNEKV